MPSNNPTSPGLLGRIRNALGRVFNLFPLGGTKGGIVVRQQGGIPGTEEMQVWYDSVTKSITINNPRTFSGFQFQVSGTNVAQVTSFSDYNVQQFGGKVGVGTTSSFVFQNGYITLNGWLQGTPGEAALASSFTDAVGTLANTNLSLTVIAGRSYRIQGYLIVSNSLAADGFQMDFNGGTATATTFDAALSPVGSDVAGTVVSAALATKMNFTTVTGTNRIFVQGYLKCANAGTLILRAATNTTVSGTMTLGAGSWLALADTVNL
jgi:hypothetical protein